MRIKKISTMSFLYNGMIFMGFMGFCLYRSLYADEYLYSEVGVQMTIDIALALRNAKSIVESLYSVTKSQCVETDKITVH